MLADLSAPGESVLLEQLDGGAEEKPRLRLASNGDLRDRLDKAAACSGDLPEGAFERCVGDARPRWCLSTKMQAIRHGAAAGGFFAYSRWCFSASSRGEPY